MELPKTYVVECFLPGVDDAAVHRAADDAAAAVRALGGPERGIEYLGALLMAIDEVVLHTFRSVDRELVDQASAAADLRFERVIESIEVAPAPATVPPRRSGVSHDVHRSPNGGS